VRGKRGLPISPKRVPKSILRDAAQLGAGKSEMPRG
jgi:hypothetical protein